MDLPNTMLFWSNHLTQITSASFRVKKDRETEKSSTSTHTRQCMPQRNRFLTLKSLCSPSQTRSRNWQWRGTAALEQWGKSGLWQFSGVLSWSSTCWDTPECQRSCHHCPEVLARHCLTKLCGRTRLPSGFPQNSVHTLPPSIPRHPAHSSNFSGRISVLWCSHLSPEAYLTKSGERNASYCKQWRFPILCLMTLVCPKTETLYLWPGRNTTGSACGLHKWPEGTIQEVFIPPPAQGFRHNHNHIFFMQ